MSKAIVKTFFEKDTFTCVYVVSCPETKKAAVIDTVLDLDVQRGSIETKHADLVLEHIKENGLTVDWILETHVHADHATAAQYYKQKLDGKPKIAIGANITGVQQVFKEKFNLGDDFIPDGSQWDHLFQDGEKFNIGNLNVNVIHTPGHTPACISYYIENDVVFTGDTIFMPDMGTARCDFPKGSAETLFDSVRRILGLPSNVRVFVGHDYAPGGRDYAWESTIEEELNSNKHVKEGIDRNQFVKLRTERDSTLAAPRLLLAVMQINIRGGRLPPKESNGTRYFKIPITSTVEL